MRILKPDPTKTILTISVGFIIIYFITKWNWAISVSLVVGLIGIFSTYLSIKINFLWVKLTWILSLVIPNIMLGTIFYLVLFPMSVLSRFFGNKSPLKLNNESDSVFINSNKKFNKVSFEKPW